MDLTDAGTEAALHQIPHGKERSNRERGNNPKKGVRYAGPCDWQPRTVQWRVGGRKKADGCEEDSLTSSNQGHAPKEHLIRPQSSHAPYGILNQGTQGYGLLTNLPTPSMQLDRPSPVHRK